MRKINGKPDLDDRYPPGLQKNADKVLSRIAHDRLFIDDSLEDKWVMRVEWDSNSLSEREFADVVATLAKSAGDFSEFRALPDSKGDLVARIDYAETQFSSSAMGGGDNPGQGGNDNPGQGGNDNPGQGGDDTPGRGGQPGSTPFKAQEE